MGKNIRNVVLALVIVLPGCAHQQAFSDAQNEIDNQDRVIEQLTARNEALTSEIRVYATRNEALTAELSSLRAGSSGLDRDLAGMSEQMRAFEARLAELSSRAGGSDLGLGDGVRLKPHSDGMAVEVAETVLFASGKAELTESGRSVLAAIAGKLVGAPGTVRVEGHTDNAPVVVHAREYPMGNLELSGRRALVVADFLIKRGGMAANDVAFAGYGEHRPLAPNDSPEAMRRNRRVEIVIVERR